MNARGRTWIPAIICWGVLLPAAAQQAPPPVTAYDDPRPAAQQLTPAKAAEPAAPAKTTTPAAPVKRELEVSAGGPWVDSALDVQPGDRILLAATGTIQYLGVSACGPEGLPRTLKDLLRSFPVNTAGGGALVGRIGGAAAVPFLVGPKNEIVARSAGRLYLGINQPTSAQSSGAFQVTVEVTPAAAEIKTSPAPAFAAGLLEQVPRRVRDRDDNPGDMVNFLVLGSEQQVRHAFADAGWVLVDRTKAEAVLHAVLSTASRQSYLEMPMSELYLFGHAQDFGYARAEPITVVAQRHHLRLWRAPFDVEGVPVWAGAATHDLGFEKDQRTGSVTHHIDPDVDQERDFVRDTLQHSGAVLQTSYLLPQDPVRDAKTATGGSFHSDGRVLILVLH